MIIMFCVRFVVLFRWTIQHLDTYICIDRLLVARDMGNVAAVHLSRPILAYRAQRHPSGLEPLQWLLIVVSWAILVGLLTLLA